MRGLCVAVIAAAIELALLSADSAPGAEKLGPSTPAEEPLSPLFLRNARITLEVACLAKPGESLLILTNRNPRRMACSRALEAAAVELGLLPVIMDLSAYRSAYAEKSRRDPLLAKSMVVKPVKEAVEAADIVVRAGLGVSYDSLLGRADAEEQSLTGQERRMSLQTANMDKWEITPEEVAAIRRRTMWLVDKLRTAKTIRVTTPAGSDFSAGVGPGAKWHPVLGIMPLYGEVAVVPQVGPETAGVFVVDGPTYYGVRPLHETDRKPLRVVVKDGRFQEMSGDAEQAARFQKLIDGVGSAKLTVDEVGIVTTSIAANDAHWSSGTHSHDSLHIALGDNVRRGQMIHGAFHMDCDIRRPTVSLDGLVIVKDGVFVDSVIRQ